MNISSYGKSQLSLASALLPVQTMPMCALDIESQEIYQVMFRDALVDFSPSPNGEMVDQENQIQLQQTRSLSRRQAANRIQLKSLQRQKQHLSPLIMDSLLIQLMLMVLALDHLRAAMKL